METRGYLLNDPELTVPRSRRRPRLKRRAQLILGSMKTKSLSNWVKTPYDARYVRKKTRS